VLTDHGLVDPSARSRDPVRSGSAWPPGTLAAMTPRARTPSTSPAEKRFKTQSSLRLRPPSSR
jgi:hypothetical protein